MHTGQIAIARRLPGNQAQFVFLLLGVGMQGKAALSDLVAASEVEAVIAAVGEVLFSTTSNPAVYTFAEDELYVRAKVTSSRLHPNPFADGDHETAWIQPVIP